ncbi:MAG: DUF4317 domain-containing protein [Lachnospiraceae bacterium]|nr:DUF4317 domain-containing protein [Lachnospiraceae bacterium]
MINREDMLELTRRMTPQRTCFDRIAGAYMTKEGEIDDTFNIHFLKLSPSEQARNLALAKEVPFARTNEGLIEYDILPKLKEKHGIYQLLNGLLSCGLKNDALAELLYEQISDGYPFEKEYAIFLFHGIYDIPRKAGDKGWLEGSEEVYEFMICTISPMAAKYQPDKPVFGFLYPAFSDRSSDPGKIDIYDRKAGEESEGLIYKFTGLRK